MARSVSRCTCRWRFISRDGLCPAFTQDLSGRGIFFYAETALPEGAVVELTFTMPSEITLAENMPVRCRGRVLRASASQGGQRNGIAVQLDSYEYLPSERTDPQFVRVSPPSAAGARFRPGAALSFDFPAADFRQLSRLFKRPSFALQSGNPAVWRVPCCD